MGAKGEPSQHVTADNGFWEESRCTSPLLTPLHSPPPQSCFSALSAILFSNPFSAPSPLFPSFFFFPPLSLTLFIFTPSTSLSSNLQCVLCVWPEGTGRRVICLVDRWTAPTDCYKLWHQPWLQSWEEEHFITLCSCQTYFHTWVTAKIPTCT